ncbi:MAG: hypothetical protein ACKOXJ_01075, partial [Alphaproteobacteria bacterium]
IRKGLSVTSIAGVDSRLFRKPTRWPILNRFKGAPKQGGSMVVNMNVCGDDGKVKNKIRVEFGVQNMPMPGMITTGDRLVIKSISKIDNKDRETFVSRVGNEGGLIKQSPDNGR